MTHAENFSRRRSPHYPGGIKKNPDESQRYAGHRGGLRGPGNPRKSRPAGSGRRAPGFVAAGPQRFGNSQTAQNQKPQTSRPHPKPISRRPIRPAGAAGGSVGLPDEGKRFYGLDRRDPQGGARRQIRQRRFGREAGLRRGGGF